MMRAPAALRRLDGASLASTRGVAAIEFAMMLPVLATLLLATFDGGRALAIYMKVRATTYALDFITNQYKTIASTDMATIVGASLDVLAPYSSSPAIVTISQIAVSSKGARHRGVELFAQRYGARAGLFDHAAIVEPGDAKFLSDPGRGELQVHADVRLFHGGRDHFLG